MSALAYMGNVPIHMFHVDLKFKDQDTILYCKFFFCSSGVRLVLIKPRSKK